MSNSGDENSDISEGDNGNGFFWITSISCIIGNNSSVINNNSIIDIIDIIDKTANNNTDKDCIDIKDYYIDIVDSIDIDDNIYGKDNDDDYDNANNRN